MTMDDVITPYQSSIPICNKFDVALDDDDDDDDDDDSDDDEDNDDDDFNFSII